MLYTFIVNRSRSVGNALISAVRKVTNRKYFSHAEWRYLHSVSCTDNDFCHWYVQHTVEKYHYSMQV